MEPMKTTDTPIRARERDGDPEAERAAYADAVREGITDADAGRTVPYEDVRRWVLSWGTDDELPPPDRCA